MRKLFPAVAILMSLSLLATQARAEVRDDAKFFSQSAIRSADDTTEQMRRDLGKELLIETYPAIPADRISNYSPPNKDSFFSTWGNQRAEQAHVDGVYVLINKDPTYLFVTAGNKTRQRDFTQSDENELRSAMLPLMKQKQYDDALSKAVDFVSSRIRANRQQSGGMSNRVQTPPPLPGNHYSNNSPNAPSVAPRGGFGIVGLIILAVVVFIVFRVVRGLFGGFSRYGGGSMGGYGGQGYGGPGYSGGGGFGRGFLGGIFGGMAGNWLGNRFNGQNSNWGNQPPSNFGGGGSSGSFNDSSSGSDTSFSGGAGGGFDSGSSGSSDSGSSGGGGGGDGGAGGSF